MSHFGIPLVSFLAPDFCELEHGFGNKGGSFVFVESGLESEVVDFFFFLLLLISEFLDVLVFFPELLF